MSPETWPSSSEINGAQPLLPCAQIEEGVACAWLGKDYPTQGVLAIKAALEDTGVYCGVTLHPVGIRTFDNLGAPPVASGERVALFRRDTADPALLLPPIIKSGLLHLLALPELDESVRVVGDYREVYHPRLYRNNPSMRNGLPPVSEAEVEALRALVCLHIDPARAAVQGLAAVSQAA